MPNIHQIRRSFLYAPAPVVGGGNAAETDAFLARTSGLDGTHIAAYEALINGLVQDGLFAGLDGLYILATEDTTTALLNLRQDAFNLTESGPPTFTADQGYTGNTGTVRLQTGYTPSTSGGSYSANSGSWGWYNRSSRTDDQTWCSCGVLGSASNAALAYDKAATAAMSYTINSTNIFETTGVSNSNAQGQYVISRTAANSTFVRKNEAPLGTDTDTETTNLPDRDFWILSYNNGVTGGAPTGDQIAAFHFGIGRSTADADQIMSRINAYMTAVGANVY